MKVVVLCSGGMDSVTALYWARREHDVVAVASFDYGAKHNHRELPFAAEHAAKLKLRHEMIPLEFVNRLFVSDLLKSGGAVPEGHYAAETMKQTVVPFRNAIMLSIACGFAESVGAQGLVIAAHTGDHTIYPDCREDFMCALGEAMRLGTYAGVQLLRPFIALARARSPPRARGSAWISPAPGRATKAGPCTVANAARAWNGGKRSPRRG
jgi:7-cyano-7-deazaguanine synthase